MTFVPVVHRELRSAARQDFTYNLRALGVAALLLGMTVFLFRHGDESNFGGRLFANLHLTLFCAIWLLVPFLTADCISRERREGTLGLLFLTRLNSRDVVIAKGLAQGLRAFTLWLAVLPIVAVPFVLGGVTWFEALTSIFVNSGAIVLALAAGLIASSYSRVWTRVAVWAGVLSALFCFAYVVMFLVLISGSVMPPSRMFKQLLGSPLAASLFEGLRVAVDWDTCWQQILSRFGRTARTRWMLGSGATMLASLLIAFIAFRLTASRVRRMWRDEPPPPWMVWTQTKFCQPVFFRNFFRRWMKARLDANPVGWLELRSWTGRMVAWSWLGLVALLYSCMLTDSRLLNMGGLAPSSIHYTMAWLLGASMAISAAGSFRRERESGVLELLLVSPLGEDQIIMGRLRGLWFQFLPAGILLVAAWCFLTSLFGLSNYYGGAPDLQGVVYYVIGFMGVPVIGLYFSLACRTFLAALLATLGVGLLAAPILASWVWWFSGLSRGGGLMPSNDFLVSGPLLPFQILLTVICWFGLSVRLKRRTFPLQRQGS